MDTTSMERAGVVGPGRRQRRRYSAEFKEQVIVACRSPGVSIAAIALANGLNANMLRKWLVDSEQQLPAPREETINIPERADSTPAFIPLTVASRRIEQTDIRIELQRAGTTITVTWPTSASRDCAAWLGEWLR